VIRRAAERLRVDDGVVVVVDAWLAESLSGLNRALLGAVPGWWLVGERAQELLRSLSGLVSLSVDEAGRPGSAWAARRGRMIGRRRRSSGSSGRWMRRPTGRRRPSWW
jgi:hypothetical protein